VHARAPVVGVPEVVRARLRDGRPVDPVVLEEPGVLGRDDGGGEGGGDAGQRDRPPVDRVALALGAQPLPARADEGGRRRVSPPQQDDLRKRDEDEDEIGEEIEREERRGIS